MTGSISVLILEDQPDDAELMVRQLDQAGFALAWQRVDNRPDYEAALAQASPATPAFDLILADYRLPQFNALRALQLLQARELDIPFVVVTGSINEEVAVECMKQGAADYVLKDHLPRLGPAVVQALAQKQLREAKRQAEAALRQAEEKYRSIFEHASEGIFQITPAGQLLTANPALVRMAGYASVADLMSSFNSRFESYVEPGRWAEFTRLIEAQEEVAGVRRQEIEPQPLEMSRIVAEARQRLDQMITTSQAEIITPATWPAGLGHGPWIEAVWVNYLSNAIKYGGQPPRLELGATERADGQVCFWVRDNGPGLTPHEQARLFTPFTRLNGGQGQGYGLGLSIVRRIVEKLGGQVGVESNGAAGQGSVFSFTLPGAAPGRGG